MKRSISLVAVAASLAVLVAGSAMADSQTATAALNAPTVNVGGNADFEWGPIVSQGNMSLQGAADVHYPQKFAGGTITATGGSAGNQTYCQNGFATDGKEYTCGMSPAPDYPHINFTDFRALAQAEGNSCGGGPCLNPTGSSFNDPVCTVNGLPKVWFFDNTGTTQFSSNSYFCGVLVSLGSVKFTGGGAGTITTTPPSNAWMQYQVGSPAGGPDTSATGEYPGDGGLHASAPYTITGVTFQGFIYTTNGYQAAGGTVILGAVQFGAGNASAQGGATIYFSSQTVFVEPPPGQVDQPIIFPAGGCFTSPTTVSIIDGTTGASIYYTLDGSNPDPANNANTILYAGPFTLSSNATVNAIATAPNMTNSKLATPAIFTFGSQCSTNQPPSITFTANPSNINAGGSSTLSWTVSNATSAVIDQGIGTISLPSGSTSVSPANTTTYTLTAWGLGGKTTAKVTVTVNTSGGTPPSINFTANPTNINAGGSSTLNWTISNATSAVIDQGVGTISPTSGSQVVSPANTTTYTLTAWGTGGMATAQVTVTVNAPQPPSISFTATPTSISFGNSSTLGWSILNATSAVIDQSIGAISPISGTRAVSPTNTTTYTLTAWGLGGSASQQVTVTVTNVPPPPPVTVQFSAASYTQSESAGFETITVTRSGSDLSGTSTVQFATSNGSAIAGTNYMGVSGTLTFNANDIAQTFDVPLINDGLADGDKTVNLRLSAPTGAGLGTPDTAVLTITDAGAANPPPPAPFISELVPFSAPVDYASPFTMRILGDNFDATGAQVIWNGATSLPVVSRSTAEIDVTVDPAIWSNTAGSYPVLVRNPGPVDSNQVNFTVRTLGSGNPPPFIISGPTATPNPTYTQNTTLQAKGGTLTAGASVTYAWMLSGTNPASTVKFVNTDTASGSSSLATFPMAGTYHIFVRVTDSITHFSVDSAAIDVVVIRDPKQIALSPNPATYSIGQASPLNLTATVSDQWGVAMSNVTNLTWNGSGLAASGLSATFATSDVNIQQVTVTASLINGLNQPVSGSDKVTIIFGAGAGGDLSNAKAYPVPFKGNSGDPGINFTGLVSGTKIRIFTITGRIVTTLDAPSGCSGTSCDVLWTVRNANLDKVASGVYLYIIEGAGQKKEGKLVIIQ